MKHEQIVNRKDHPVYSCHRRNFASITPIAPEATYSVTTWLSVVGFIIIITLICCVVPLMVGCDDTQNPPIDLVDGVDITTEFVGDTVDTTETDAIEIINVDVVEDEVDATITSCEWWDAQFWCCPNGGQCEWKTCSVENVNEQCMISCDNMVTNIESNHPNITVSLPDSFSITFPNGDSVVCQL